MKVHVNPKTGNAGQCGAEKGQCPFGGEAEHYSSEDEAREAFEASMGPAVTSLTAKRAQKEAALAAKLQETRANYSHGLAELPMGFISKSEQALLHKIEEGKKVPDSKIDEFLEANRHLTSRDPMNREPHVVAAEQIFAHLRALREQSGTPSTLPTIETFDPSTQTLFSNAQARKNASIMGKAVRREYAHKEWMEELALESERSAAAYDEENDDFTAAQHRVAAANRRSDALRSEARVQAQLRELQYCFDNDESFAKTANADVRRMLVQGSFRGAGQSEIANLPIGTVKAVR